MQRRNAGFIADHGDAAGKAIASLPPETRHRFEVIAEEVGKLVVEKNAAYGSAYALCATYLELLFPNGVHPTRYTDMLLLVRMFDKQMRIARRKDAFGESPYRDLTGYGLLGVSKDQPFEKKEKEKAPDPGERIII